MQYTDIVFDISLPPKAGKSDPWRHNVMQSG